MYSVHVCIAWGACYSRHLLPINNFLSNIHNYFYGHHDDDAYAAAAIVSRI